MPRKPNANCIICTNPVYRRPNSLVRVFCSRKCYGIACQKLRPCLECGKPIKAKRNAKTCSRACSNKTRKGMKYKSPGRPPASKVAKVSTNRNRLIARDGEKCSICHIGPIWNEMPLRLEIDHKDGNRFNDDPSNLRLLCPNCHSQTETYAARNVGRYKKLVPIV